MKQLFDDFDNHSPNLQRLAPAPDDAAVSVGELDALLQLEPGPLNRSFETTREDLLFQSPGRVLVIEDNLKDALQISDIVESMGHEIVGTVTNDRDAIEMAAQNSPNLILSDIQLGEGGCGIATINRILASNPLTAVVLITGYPELISRGTAPLPASVIRKPFHLGEIRTAVAQALQFA